MASILNFQDLEIWQKAHSMVLAVYKVSRAFPESEIDGLTLMIRKAVVGLPAAIAEAYKINDKAEKLNRFNLAEAAVARTRYFLILASDLGYADTTDFLLKIDELDKLLNSEISEVTNQ